MLMNEIEVVGGMRKCATTRQNPRLTPPTVGQMHCASFHMATLSTRFLDDTCCIYLTGFTHAREEWHRNEGNGGCMT